MIGMDIRENAVYFGYFNFCKIRNPSHFFVNVNVEMFE